ncbi:hypothetical protein [Methanoregula sp.]|uniref:hypothetical protein n=1 Tax=Methanoregula sp. TaxID=2052170 RepID=UPI002611A9AD|nr:hypothetical protein [Methanoregula sp.]MDD5142717.1 hypothetical protein [Methanoregula sp.]
MRPRRFPPLLVNIIHTALVACDGIRFHAGNTCPRCGSRLSGYDERRKRFALLVDDEEKTDVRVILRRSYCKNCDTIINPPEPFYPGTRIGAPVVDLCRTLSSEMPYSRVSTYLERMGVAVDRWSVRHYARAPLREIPFMDIFGMKIPVSIVSLSTLAGSLQGPEQADMDTLLMICNYPGESSSVPKHSDR